MSGNSSIAPRFVTEQPKTTSHETNEVTLQHELQNHFLADSYKIQQPYIQIMEEGYAIESGDQKEKYRAVRPRRWGRTIVARLAGLSAVFVSFAIGFFVLMFLGKTFTGAGFLILGTLANFGLALLAGVVVSKNLSPKRVISLYQGPSQTPLLSVMPESGFFYFQHHYIVHDSNRRPIAQFKKSYFESFFRKKWHCYDMKGTYLFSAIEDSLILALMRRYLGLGRLIPLHFAFSKNGGTVFGRFTRRFSLRDKYTLEYNRRAADSWLMVTTAILLDTGEER